MNCHPLELFNNLETNKTMNADTTTRMSSSGFGYTPSWQPEQRTPSASTSTPVARNQQQRAHSVTAMPSELQRYAQKNEERQQQERSNANNQPWWQRYYQQYNYQLPAGRKPTVFGPYLLMQTLGEGEFGKVKFGIEVRTGKEVAIKLIRKDSLEPHGRMTKVEREIKVLQKLRHPNIVELFDVIETEKYIGIILQCASGGELFDYILAHRYLKEKDAQRLFAQLISGVHYMHQNQTVHRDLKLENLLLDKDRNVLITDFGFANEFNSNNSDLMSTSCGSPCYAAPELVTSQGAYVGPAVDIWSCGVILFAMLCGYLPYDDDPSNPESSNINLLYKYIQNSELAYPEYISDEARHLISAMLVPSPEYRCNMKDIMAHSWLSAHQHLFEFVDQRIMAEKSAIAAAKQQEMVMLGEQERRNTIANDTSVVPSHTNNNAATVRDSDHQDEALVPTPTSTPSIPSMISSEDVTMTESSTSPFSPSTINTSTINNNSSIGLPQPSQHQQPVTTDRKRRKSIVMKVAGFINNFTDEQREKRIERERRKSIVGSNNAINNDSGFNNGSSFQSKLFKHYHKGASTATVALPGPSPSGSSVSTPLKQKNQAAAALTPTEPLPTTNNVTATATTTNAPVATAAVAATAITAPSPTSVPAPATSTTTTNTRKKTFSMLLNKADKNQRPFSSSSKSNTTAPPIPTTSKSTTAIKKEKAKPTSTINKQEGGGNKLKGLFMNALPSKYTTSAATSPLPDKKSHIVSECQGPVSQATVNKLPPDQLYILVKQVLDKLHIEYKHEPLEPFYKLKCTQQFKPVAKPAAQQQPTAFGRILRKNSPSPTTTSSAAAAINRKAQEIKFSVEICAIRNLSGLYTVVMKRIKGSTPAYKDAHNQFFDELVPLLKEGGAEPTKKSNTAEQEKKKSVTLRVTNEISKEAMREKKEQVEKEEVKPEAVEAETKETSGNNDRNHDDTITNLPSTNASKHLSNTGGNEENDPASLNTSPAMEERMIAPNSNNHHNNTEIAV